MLVEQTSHHRHRGSGGRVSGTQAGRRKQREGSPAIQDRAHSTREPAASAPQAQGSSRAQWEGAPGARVLCCDLLSLTGPPHPPPPAQLLPSSSCSLELPGLIPGPPKGP